MTYTTLISVAQLRELQTQRKPLALFDCSFDLMQPEAGHAQFLAQRIPGAQHADLDRHLSTHDASVAVNAGRHPLPQREVFAQWLRQMGVQTDDQVVVYDRNGMNYCGRLWWMLKWCGHEAVAVLDGGLQAWTQAGHPTESGEAAPCSPSHFELRTPCVSWRDTASVHAQLNQGQQTVIDARGAPRYRGEVEPLDPIAGHIPGAINRPFNSNLDENGFFKKPEQLRQEFMQLLAGRDAKAVVHQCGSGVSAVPNLLAMEVAGLHGSTLYPGSWSEWCNTPGMPVAKGA
jgi:thiosulfate/3-mercaptopyruvate sulfurtransferase